MIHGSSVRACVPCFPLWRLVIDGTFRAERKWRQAVASLLLASSIAMPLASASPVYAAEEDAQEKAQARAESRASRLADDGAMPGQRESATPRDADRLEFRLDDAPNIEGSLLQNGIEIPVGRRFGPGSPLYRQIMRDFEVASDGMPSAAPGVRPARGARGASHAASDFETFLHSAYRDTVQNLLRSVRDSIIDERDAASFSIAGIDFLLMRGADRRSLIVHGDELLPTIGHSPLSQDGRPDSASPIAAGSQFGGAGGGARMPGQGAGAVTAAGTGYQTTGRTDSGPGTAQSSPAPQSGGNVDLTEVILESIYRFLMDPLTLFVLILVASVWLLAESMRWINERRQLRRQRRQRRLRRRAARAA